MSSNKFLSVVSGVKTLLTAIATSAGAGDANKIIATDGSGRIDITFMPSGVGADTLSIEASENLSAGDFINIHDVSGARVRKADNSNTRPAHGFVLSSVTSGANATVYLSGANTGLTSLTPGTRYYLGTAGVATATAPSASGEIVQYLGAANSTTSLVFEDNEYTAIS